MTDPENLFERLRGLDLKEQSPAELRVLVREVRALLDKDHHGHGMDLDLRVRLLRLWHVLLLLGADSEKTKHHKAEPGLDPVPESDQTVHPEAESPEVDPELDIERHLTEPDLVAVDTGPHGSPDILSPDSVKTTAVVLDSPASPRPPVQANEHRRIRMQLVKDGILMNHPLPAGTIVLVYPMDGAHLIEQGIAVELPDLTDEATAGHFERVEF